MIPGGGLRGRLGSGQFAVTAEVGPPRGADPAAVRRKVAPLRGWVDAVNITDNAGAHVRMASWAGCLLAPSAAVAEIYGWVDPSGEVTYSNLPPPKNARVIDRI